MKDDSMSSPRRKALFRLKCRLILYAVPLIFYLVFNVPNLIPRCKGYQSEAKQQLVTIARYQEAFFAEFDYYANSLEDLGLDVRPEHRYFYKIKRDPTGDGYAAIAQVKKEAAFGTKTDIWVLDHNLNLQNLVNACEPEPMYFHEAYFVMLFYLMLIDLVSSILFIQSGKPLDVLIVDHRWIVYALALIFVIYGRFVIHGWPFSTEMTVVHYKEFIFEVETTKNDRTTNFIRALLPFSYILLVIGFFDAVVISVSKLRRSN